MKKFSVVLALIHFSSAKPRLVSFKGSPDFKKVTLNWQVDSVKQLPSTTFKIKFCENQIWGEHFCREQLIEEIPTRNFFSTVIHGLKMSTNYSFYLETDLDLQNSRQQRKLSELSHIFVQTRGFNAQAIDCRKDVTDVLVETGPNFGGKISAEGHEKDCFINGNRRASNTSYLFSIDHDKCGSGMNSSGVWTYVVVQENMSILTQSTRRFLVLCQYKMPGTFTVKAGFQMPGADPGPTPGTLESVEPEYYDDFLNPSQSLEVGDSNHLSNMIVSDDNSASQRRSRTLTNNLFGLQEVGDGGDTTDKRMWMIVITVSAGLVMFSVMAVLVACRPRTSQQQDDSLSGEEMSASTNQVNFADTETLQPKKNKKIYRPTESRA